MILCTLVGLAVQRFANVEPALLGGLLAGFLVAPFVPLPRVDPPPTDPVA